MMEPTTSQEEHRTPPPEPEQDSEAALLDHLHLPESDGTFVKNFQEHPQSVLLTDSITPVLQRLHPDGQYCIGQDCGIYWRLPQPLEEPWRAAVSPDWFYVPNRPPLLEGRPRRSYVMWREWLAPAIVIEFVSGDGSEERDRTPNTGKFWVYENTIRTPYYAIYEVDPGKVEVYQLLRGAYQLVPANERGHYPIESLGAELGIWRGRYQNAELPWLRWWDKQGQLLLTGHELADQQRQQVERLAAKLRELGHDPG